MAVAGHTQGVLRAIQPEARVVAGPQEAPRPQAGRHAQALIPVCCMVVGMRTTLHTGVAAGARVCMAAVSRIKTTAK